MRAGADLRLLRAAVFAAACATLAAAGHLSTAGPGIPLWTLATGWAAAFAVALPLVGRERRSLPAIAAILAAAQLALHVLYHLGQHGTLTARFGGGSSSGGGGGGGGGGPVALAARLLCDDHAVDLTQAEAVRMVRAAGLGPHAGHGGTGAAASTGGDSCLGDAIASLASWPMLLGHLLAALTAGWLLRRGEAALWQLITLSTQLPPLRRALRLARVLSGGGPRANVPAPLLPPRADRAFLPAPRGVVLARAVTRRGPPARTAHRFTLAA
ncbi:hypothetical protein [Streptomyces sp. NBC_01803]|uniref:hypothetical protein n=1 Tax=Streptomyces sp. NBC_01803 TaxID=2975946 RepID=UPI002DD9C6F2|nr:hypothetical protein [Streptomyces sp. NBC_01803]WSA45363.1 hypothetical protein OIE51_14785 [Streptomyces sp. NBC_01803]